MKSGSWRNPLATMKNQLIVSEADKRCILRYLNLLTKGDPETSVDFNQLGTACGLPKECARIGVDILQGAGLVRFDGNPIDGRVSLTALGLEKANWLEMPAWRRWGTDPNIVKPLVSAIIGGIIVGLINLLIKVLAG
jgi:hypothetical protein